MRLPAVLALALAVVVSFSTFACGKPDGSRASVGHEAPADPTTTVVEPPAPAAAAAAAAAAAPVATTDVVAARTPSPQIKRKKTSRLPAPQAVAPPADTAPETVAQGSEPTVTGAAPTRKPQVVVGSDADLEPYGTSSHGGALLSRSAKFENPYD